MEPTMSPQLNRYLPPTFSFIVDVQGIADQQGKPVAAPTFLFLPSEIPRQLTDEHIVDIIELDDDIISARSRLPMKMASYDYSRTSECEAAEAELHALNSETARRRAARRDDFSCAAIDESTMPSAHAAPMIYDITPFLHATLHETPQSPALIDEVSNDSAQTPLADACQTTVSQLLRNAVASILA